jgi:hypothetical protein
MYFHSLSSLNEIYDSYFVERTVLSKYLKVKSDEKIEENVQNLLGLSNHIFQKILDSEIYFPTYRLLYILTLFKSSSSSSSSS